MKPKVGSKKTKRRYNKSKAKRRYNKSTIKRKNNKLSLKRRKYYKQRGGGIIMKDLKKMVNLAANLMTLNKTYKIIYNKRLTDYDARLTDIHNELLGYRDNLPTLPTLGKKRPRNEAIPTEEIIENLERELNDIELKINAEAASAAASAAANAAASAAASAEARAAGAEARVAAREEAAARSGGCR